MKARIFGGVVVAVLSLAVPAIAQDRGHAAGGGGDSGGARNSGGGGSAGTAVSRGDGGSYTGGGGTPSVGATASGAGGYTGGSGVTPGGGMTGTPGGGVPGNVGIPAPTPMGGTRALMGARGRPGAEARATLRNELAGDPVDHAIPGGSRPNHGHPTVGTAVERPKPQTGGGGTNDLYSYTYSPYADCSVKGQCYNYGLGYDSSYYYALMPYYYSASFYRWPPLYGPAFDPYSAYGYGGFGLGSFYYDPMWFGSGFSGMDFGGGYAGGSSASGPPQGGLKLKVKPEEAEVVVDGVRRGKAFQFNGAFKRLNLPAGTHHIELSAPGFQSLNFDVVIEPRDTVAYRGTMQAVQPVK